MTKTVQQMTAAEYKEWLLNNPEDAKKLDAPVAPAALPTGYWRNGQWVKYENNEQLSQNGVIK
jgi:hypothetical protein